jgi:starch synthase
MKILFVTSQAHPFTAPANELSRFCGFIPAELAKQGHDVEVIVPYYRCIRNAGIRPAEKPGSNRKVYLQLENKAFEATFFSIDYSGYKVTFVVNDQLFDREGIFQGKAGEYPDNAARFIFFAKAVIANLLERTEKPNIIHTNDWSTGILPAILKLKYGWHPELSKIKNIFTIHSLVVQGLFWKNYLIDTEIPWEYFVPEFLEFWGQLNFLKSGIICSDRITTVSDKYADEIIMPENGYGLDGFFKSNRSKISGILNGLDYNTWDPQKDVLVQSHYSAMDIKGKAFCKSSLSEEFKLKNKPDIPLIAFAGEMTDDNGMGLIENTLPELLGMDAQFIFYGSGAPHYYELLANARTQGAGNISFMKGDDEHVLHRIFAGADLFILPALISPSAQSALCALKYGAVPVVRATGGLDDVVNNSNGFKFEEYDEYKFISTLGDALSMFTNDKNKWKQLMQNGMNSDHSWALAAKSYNALYQTLT